MKLNLFLRVLTLGVSLATTGAAQDATNGRNLFGTFCSQCHGYGARGDGPKAKSLEKSPANLTLLSAGNGGLFPTARAAYRIDGREYVAAHGGSMPFYGDIMGAPFVTIETPDGPLEVGQAIADLLVFLQAIQQDAPGS